MLASASSSMAATVSTSRRLAGAPVAAGGRHPAGVSPMLAGRVLTGILIAVLTYAVFAGGASSFPAEARVQVALAVISIAVCAVALWQPGLRPGGSPAAWAGVAVLGGFAAWSGLSLIWSVNPEGTWVELNRALSYVLMAGLGIVAGCWNRRAAWDVALGYAAVAVLVALYAVGGKIAPGLHLDGLFDLNHTGSFSRLREPVEYWNGLALFLALAVPILLRLVVDETRPRWLRLASLGGLPLLFTGIGLTYSRGGVLACLVGVGVLAVAAGSRLRTLMYVALALLATAPALAIGFSADDLKANFLPVSERSGEGLLLGLALVASIAALVAGGRAIVALETRVAPSAARSRLIGRALLGLLVAAALAGVVTMAVSDRGLGGTISHGWDTFRSPRGAAGDRLFDPSRLLSSSSGNRWVWWSEAVGAWSDRPLAGWGAGSFPVTHRQYRSDQLDVLQPHSVPLQFLSEVGLLGLVLAAGGLLLLFWAAAAAARRLGPGPERGIVAALLGASAAWAVHGFYDWDWDIPGITLPAFLFLGVMGARAIAFAPPSSEREIRISVGARAAALAAVALVLGTYAVSAVLPAWSESKTQSALESVRRSASPEELRRAQADADFASRLDPLSVQPLLAAATLAERRGRVLQAREYLLKAIGRHPESTVAWTAVARLELRRGDQVNVRRALARVLDLDPHNRISALLLSSAELISVPPGQSPTATGTPLVAIVGQTPPR